VAPAPEVGPQCLRRDGEHDGVGTVERLGGVGRGRQQRGQDDPGQVVRIVVALVDGVGHLGTPGPQPDVATGVGHHLGERGAPRARAEHGDPAHLLGSAHDAASRR
jgi:hypothetical protein